MNSRASSYFFFVLLFGVVIAAIFIFLPFLTPLVLAVAAAVIVYPAYVRILKFVGDGHLGKTTAALVTVIMVLVVILVPLFFLVGSIYAEVQTLYGILTDEGSRSQVVDALNSGSQLFSNLVFGVLPAHSFDSFNVTTYMKSGLESIFANLDTVFASLAKVAGYALVFLMALFFFLRDGIALKNKILSWSPQLSANEGYVTGMLAGAIRSVFAGTLVVGTLDGLMLGLAFLVFGIPAPALWGTVTAVASLVPGLGITLVIWPAAAYLVLSGNYVFAIGMVLWGYLAVIVVDHMVGPSIVNRGLHIHPFPILLSVLGGLVFFGIVGFITGPLILVLLVALLEIFRTSFIGPKNGAQ